METTTLADAYFELWGTTDDARRHELAGEVFAASAVQHVSPAGVSLTGLDAIEANIARVNRENIQQAGMTFTEGEVTPNHDALQVRWSVVNPAGATVATGRDFLVLDGDGRVAALYMFMGQ